MESIGNYESDDGNVKMSNKSSSKESSQIKEKRRYSSDDDSSDASSSPRDRSRKRLNEDDRYNRKSPSPRKSSHKSSRSDKHKSNDGRSDRHRHRSSSRDSDRYERKKSRNDSDRKRHRQRSRDREKRSEQTERRRDRDHKDRHNERYDDRHNRRENERRNDDDRDYGRKREEPSNRSSSHNDSRANDSRSNSSSSNSSSAIRRAEALNRTIERRANEKVQQLQKLGIEIPALMQQHHMKVLNQPAAPINPISTILLNPSAVNDNTKTEADNLTLNLSNFTSPVLTNAKYTEQMQKKKLIWGAKKESTTETATTNNKWEAAKFSQDSDGKVASKFLRLMGMKNAPATATTPDDSSVEKREEMFTSMEHQYEIARQATHTMRGMGFGFGSQSRPC